MAVKLQASLGNKVRPRIKIKEGREEERKNRRMEGGRGEEMTEGRRRGKGKW